VPDYTQLVGICSLGQAESGSSFPPYLALQSSACPKQNFMWWLGNPGSKSDFFFFFNFFLHFQLSIYLLWLVFSLIESTTGVV